jgi:hypothetical protein
MAMLLTDDHLLGGILGAEIAGEGDFEEEIGDNFDDDNQEGCCFPSECCMPGSHLRSECHTAEMIEAAIEAQESAA